ncbi:MAG: hypothetical protein NC452_01905 [Eubacterium sp.]|nr:hypothetical protein [Eubacterium sp.]
MNNLCELIKIAKRRQELADEAVYSVTEHLKTICGNRKAYEEAEEEILLYIYEGTDPQDNKITLKKLLKNIKALNG